ncbi:MAG: phytoene synthase [Melioribacteraceae bacterium]|nr:MAG: phytoene synthase [Melioribacteraceae bacterium]
MLTEQHEISKQSKSSFYYALNLLPEEKRDAMHTVYAFCRKTDDIIDEGNIPDDIRYEQLRKWRVELEKGLYGNSDFSLLNKLSTIIKKFNIPFEPFFELIKGMEMDLQKRSYVTVDDLMEYCYYVASTVGLMCIEIFGYKNKSAVDFAINLGYALQLTNIMRDVKVDAEIGRIYLPSDLMTKFGYSEKDIFANNYNSNYLALMNELSTRAHDYFDKANENLDFEDKPAMFAARAMQHIYFNLLKKLEKKEFNVFEERINVSKLQKTGIALGVWAKYSLVY